MCGTVSDQLPGTGLRQVRPRIPSSLALIRSVLVISTGSGWQFRIAQTRYVWRTFIHWSEPGVARPPREVIGDRRYTAARWSLSDPVVVTRHHPTTRLCELDK